MQSEKGKEFIEALTECTDRSIFELRSVQILVDHHYRFWYKINFYSILMPYFLQVFLFWVWSNFVLAMRLHDLRRENISAALGQQIETEDWSLGDYNDGFKLAILIITVYLVIDDFTILIQSCCNCSGS